MAKRQTLIKTPEQITGIRKAGVVVRELLTMIGEFVREGISTEELDSICGAFIMSRGAKSASKGYHGFPKYTCISLNEVICHGIPSNKEILKSGDILNIDVTVVLDGYYADASRMYMVGQVSPEAALLVETTKKALMLGIKEVYPGNVFGNIGYAISSFAEPRGYSVVREYTGHGVGLSLHEEPYVYHKAPKNSGPKMEAGMVFTIEPMINIGTYKTKMMHDKWTVKTLDGKLSAQWEHTILVTTKGYEILT